MDTFSEYLALCWLNNDPLELPRSTGMFRRSLLVYFVICYLLQANMIDDPVESLVEVIAQVVLMLSFVGGLLFLNRTLYLYVQVATAIIFSANIVSVFVIPVMVWLTVSEDVYSYYLFSVLILWYFAIVSYIFRFVLVVNIPASMVTSLFYFIFTYLGAFAFGQAVL